MDMALKYRHEQDKREVKFNIILVKQLHIIVEHI